MALSPSEKLKEYLDKNGKGDKTWAELTKMFNPGRGDEWARNAMRNVGYSGGGMTIETRIEHTKYRKENRSLQKESNGLVQKIIDLEKDISLLSRIKEYNPSRFDIPLPKSKSKNESTAIVQWSDWHIDEVVEFETVNWMNEYNKEIAKKRAFKLFENTVKLIDSQRSAVDIYNLVIHLGGDAIGGYIHPELQQTNSMSPLQGIFYAKDLVVSGLEYLLQHGNLKNIIVVTSRGNHPRLTPKMQFANDYSMNLETFLYWSLVILLYVCTE